MTEGGDTPPTISRHAILEDRVTALEVLLKRAFLVLLIQGGIVMALAIAVVLLAIGAVGD